MDEPSSGSTQQRKLAPGERQIEVYHMSSLPLFRLLTASLAFLIAGASGWASKSSLTSMGDDTYAITRQASTAFERDTDELQNEAKADAARLCREKGKELKVISVTLDRPRFASGYAKATVVFKMLAAGDPALAENAPIVVEYSRKNKPEKTEGAGSPTGDLYGDLLKLDDLRKRGILTDEEFKAEKQKVLNRPH